MPAESVKEDVVKTKTSRDQVFFRGRSTQLYASLLRLLSHERALSRSTESVKSCCYDYIFSVQDIPEAWKEQNFTKVHPATFMQATSEEDLTFKGQCFLFGWGDPRGAYVSSLTANLGIERDLRFELLRAFEAYRLRVLKTPSLFRPDEMEQSWNKKIYPHNYSFKMPGWEEMTRRRLLLFFLLDWVKQRHLFSQCEPDMRHWYAEVPESMKWANVYGIDSGAAWADYATEIYPAIWSVHLREISKIMRNGKTSLAWRELQYRFDEPDLCRCEVNYDRPIVKGLGCGSIVHQSGQFYFAMEKSPGLGNPEGELYGKGWLKEEDREWDYFSKLLICSIDPANIKPSFRRPLRGDPLAPSGKASRLEKSTGREWGDFILGQGRKKPVALKTWTEDTWEFRDNRNKMYSMDKWRIVCSIAEAGLGAEWGSPAGNIFDHWTTCLQAKPEGWFAPKNVFFPPEKFHLHHSGLGQCSGWRHTMPPEKITDLVRRIHKADSCYLGDCHFNSPDVN